MRCDLDEHLGGARRGGARPGRSAGRRDDALARHRTARDRACPPGDHRSRPGGPMRSRLQRQRRHRRARAGGVARAAPPGVAGGSARPAPPGDDVADPGGADVRGRRGRGRERDPGVALVQALPPRRLRGLRPALGRAGRRSLRPGRPALRGARRRRAAAQLPAAGSPRRDAAVAPRLHRSPAGRLPEPRLLLGRRLALRRDNEARAVRGAGARMACAGRADRRRLLRHLARAHRRGTRGARGHEGRPAAERSCELPARAGAAHRRSCPAVVGRARP